MPTFVPGWSPEHSVRATARLNATGRFCTVAPPTAPPPPAISLGQFRLAHYEQGRAGDCWLHSPKQLAEVLGNALGYQSFPVCRMLLGYAGMQIAGGGNPADGGSPTDAIVAMTAQGPGLAHESLDPYSDDRNRLAMRPPPEVFADAAHYHILAPVKVSSLDQAKQLIASGHPVANGIWWPSNWDDPVTVMTGFRSGEMGHSLLLIGYAAAGIVHAKPCIQLDNWHGLLYPPLSPDVAARVPGYRPITASRTSDFWVTEDAYLSACRNAPPEHVSATDFNGLARGLVVPNPGADFADAFPV